MTEWVTTATATRYQGELVTPMIAEVLLTQSSSREFTKHIVSLCRDSDRIEDARSVQKIIIVIFRQDGMCRTAVGWISLRTTFFGGNEKKN